MLRDRRTFSRCFGRPTPPLEMIAKCILIHLGHSHSDGLPRVCQRARKHPYEHQHTVVALHVDKCGKCGDLELRYSRLYQFYCDCRNFRKHVRSDCRKFRKYVRSEYSKKRPALNCATYGARITWTFLRQTCQSTGSNCFPTTKDLRSNLALKLHLCCLT